VSELGARSYGIYLLHPPVMEAVSRGLYHFAPWVLASQALLLPLLVGLGLGLPMLAMTIVRRSPARRLYQLQFG
jgi:peptidoglycan/LPS O-acetylase OafA/YrhL